jgi:hypothetical protein
VSSKGKGRNRSHRLRQGVARWLEVPPGEPLWPVSRRPSEFRPRDEYSSLPIRQRELPVVVERTLEAGLDPLFSVLELSKPGAVDIAVKIERPG